MSKTFLGGGCQGSIKIILSGLDEHLFKLLEPITSFPYQFITAWS